MWIPKETYHTIETFTEAFNKKLKIEGKVKKATPKSNLTKNETDALQQRSQRDDIIITQADKGSAVVIIDVDGSIYEANQQLNNTYFYKEKNQMTHQNLTEIN